jgi:hypothetical protein
MDYMYYCVYLFNSFKGPNGYRKARLSVIIYRRCPTICISPFAINLDKYHKFFEEEKYCLH